MSPDEFRTRIAGLTAQRVGKPLDAGFDAWLNRKHGVGSTTFRALAESRRAMTEPLSNFAAGRWQPGTGAGSPVFDPVLGDEQVRGDGTRLELDASFAHARNGVHALALIRRDQCAQVASLCDSHGRLHVVLPDAAACHGGPGRRRRGTRRHTRAELLPSARCGAGEHDGAGRARCTTARRRP